LRNGVGAHRNFLEEKVLGTIKGTCPSRYPSLTITRSDKKTLDAPGTINSRLEHNFPGERPWRKVLKKDLVGIRHTDRGLLLSVTRLTVWVRQLLRDWGKRRERGSGPRAVPQLSRHSRRQNMNSKGAEKNPSQEGGAKRDPGSPLRRFRRGKFVKEKRGCSGRKHFPLQQKIKIGRVNNHQLGAFW